jgi:hypothetical protein
MVEMRTAKYGVLVGMGAIFCGHLTKRTKCFGLLDDFYLLGYRVCQYGSAAGRGHSSLLVRVDDSTTTGEENILSTTPSLLRQEQLVDFQLIITCPPVSLLVSPRIVAYCVDPRELKKRYSISV